MERMALPGITARLNFQKDFVKTFFGTMDGFDDASFAAVPEPVLEVAASSKKE